MRTWPTAQSIQPCDNQGIPHATRRYERRNGLDSTMPAARDTQGEQHTVASSNRISSSSHRAAHRSREARICKQRTARAADVYHRDIAPRSHSASDIILYTQLCACKGSLCRDGESKRRVTGPGAKADVEVLVGTNRLVEQ